MSFAPRALPGSLFSIVIPGAGSGVYDVLLRLLLPFLCRYGTASMYYLLLWYYAAALAMSATLVSADPDEHGDYASHLLSVMCLRTLRLKTDPSALQAVRVPSRN